MDTSIIKSADRIQTLIVKLDEDRHQSFYVWVFRPRVRGNLILMILFTL